MKILSVYLSSMEPFPEVFHFRDSRNNPPRVPISHFKDLMLYTKQEMDEHFGTLLFSDPDSLPPTQPTTLDATQSTPKYSNLCCNYPLS